jgi:hypothetical protein
MAYDPNQPNGEQERIPSDLEETAEIPTQAFRSYEARFGDSFEFEDLVSSVQDPLRELFRKSVSQNED